MNRILFFVAVLFSDPLFAQIKDEAYHLKSAPFKIPEVVQPRISLKAFSIKHYAAVSDDQTLNNAAFQKTIQPCSKSDGGKVVVNGLKPNYYSSVEIQSVNLKRLRKKLLTSKRSLTENAT